MTKKIDHARVKSLVTELLEALGEDPSREGLKETPRRIANFWREFIEYEPGKLDTTFSSVTHNQMVAVTGMKVCLLYTSPSPRDLSTSRMPSSA